MEFKLFPLVVVIRPSPSMCVLKFLLECDGDRCLLMSYGIK